MKNEAVKILAGAFLGFLLLSSSASADVEKGKRVYMKKFKAPCGMNGSAFAAQHTQDEWESVYESGGFSKEVENICPKAKFKKKYEKDLYDFSYQYAKDSGNVPSC